MKKISVDKVALMELLDQLLIAAEESDPQRHEYIYESTVKFLKKSKIKIDKPYEKTPWMLACVVEKARKELIK